MAVVGSTRCHEPAAPTCAESEGVPRPIPARCHALGRGRIGAASVRRRWGLAPGHCPGSLPVALRQQSRSYPGAAHGKRGWMATGDDVRQLEVTRLYCERHVAVPAAGGEPVVVQRAGPLVHLGGGGQRGERDVGECRRQFRGAPSVSRPPGRMRMAAVDSRQVGLGQHRSRRRRAPLSTDPGHRESCPIQPRRGAHADARRLQPPLALPPHPAPSATPAPPASGSSTRRARQRRLGPRTSPGAPSRQASP